MERKISSRRSNMKNIKNLSFILIAFLTVAFISCKGSATASYTGSDKTPLTISITSNENIKLFNTSRNANRTIVADAFTTGDGLIFYLWGTAQSGQILAPKVVDVTPDKLADNSDDPYNGKVILDIDSYNWELTLAACKTSDLTAINDITADAVLIGYGNVDMMFTNNIKFTLSPKGLAKTGTVDLDMVLGEGMFIPTGYNVDAYIYDMTTGKEVLGSDGSSSLHEGITFATTNGAMRANFTANGKDIKPGTYLFQVEFTKNGENRKYVYNDTLIVLPGSETEKKYSSTAEDNKEIVIPNLIGTKPIVPTGLTVTFNQATNDKEEIDYSGFYPVTLTWTDASNNETNFALQIAEVADSYTPEAVVNSKETFETIWDTAANNNAKWEFNYLNDIRANQRFYKAGSLFANNQSLQIYLELGKRYVVRMYAENNAGYSVASTTDSTETAAYATITAVEKDSENNSAVLKTINRYRVKYWNQGGIWNEGAVKGEESQDGKNLPRIQYWSQSDQTCAILNPLDTDNDGKGSTTAPYLYRGPADWMYWITNLTSSTESKYECNSTTKAPVPYTGYKNLDLYAIYARQGAIQIYNDQDYDIVPAYVSAFDITAPNVSKTVTNSCSKGSDTNKTVTVTLPSGTGNPDWVYDQVTFEISYSGVTYFNETQTGAARGSSNTFTIPMGQLPTGWIYNCKLTARYQMTTISYSFWVYLTE